MKKYILLLILALFLTGCSNNKQDNIITEFSETSLELTEEFTEESIEIKPEINEIINTEQSDVLESSVEQSSEKIPSIEYENITMAFVGDVYLGDTLYEYYKEANNNVLGFVDETILENFKSANIMIANHEYASTDLPDSNKDTRQLYNFKAPTDREFLWHELGVDVLSLANNHAMDYGEQSLFDTIKTLDSLNLANIGAGSNLEEAKEAYITEINGKKIAILAACRFVVDGEWYATKDTSGVLTTYHTTEYFDIVKNEIKRLKEEEKCDFVAIYVHFGTEKKNMPNENQPIIAHGYIDSGADLVIGSHAHTLQGIEFYKGKPIYYNLGNFLFSSYKVDTMIVNISINEDNTCETSILPCIAQKYKANVASEEDYQRILKYIESISINAKIDEYGNVKEKEIE